MVTVLKFLIIFYLINIWNIIPYNKTKKRLVCLYCFYLLLNCYNFSKTTTKNNFLIKKCPISNIFCIVTFLLHHKNNWNTFFFSSESWRKKRFKCRKCNTRKCFSLKQLLVNQMWVPDFRLKMKKQLSGASTWYLTTQTCFLKQNKLGSSMEGSWHKEQLMHQEH